MCHNTLSPWPPGGAAKWQLGTTQLLEAAFYANDCQSAAWNFAVEIANLRACGLTINDLRWLLAKGYIEHAIETGRECSSGARKFRRRKSLPFNGRSCAVLTDLGIAVATRLCQPESRNVAAVPSAPQLSTVDEVPRWDAASRVLWLGSKLVKRLTVPAPNQELILGVFQEHSWPDCVNNPLPRSDEIDPKRRLHDTISRLNHSHACPLIHFAGNGSGTGVRWTRIGAITQQIATGAAPERV
jgi:hypothetical protein